MSPYDKLVEIGFVLANVEHNFQAADAIVHILEIILQDDIDGRPLRPIGAAPAKAPVPRGVLAEVLARVC